jgi:nicotinamidase-related amidase
MKTILMSAIVLAGAGMAPGRVQDAAVKDAALVIIDIQGFYFENGSVPLTGSVEAARQARRALDAFRSKHLPVVHVRHVPKSVKIVEGEPADPQYRIRPEVAPAPGEKVVSKQFANSFRDTDLLEHLRANGIKRLVIAGMQTHMCVEAAVRAAHDLGFKVILVHDACATRDLSFGGRTVSAADVQTAVLAALKAYATIVSTEDWIKQGR